MLERGSVRGSARCRDPWIGAQHRVHGLAELRAAAGDLEPHRCARITGHVHAPRADEMLRTMEPPRLRCEILPERLPDAPDLRVSLPVLHPSVRPPSPVSDMV